MPSCTATSAKFRSAQAELGRQRNTENPSQPNPGLRADESPCSFRGVTHTEPFQISIQFDVGRDHLHSLGGSNAHRVIGGVLSPAHDKYSFNKPGLISSAHRVAMCRAAVQSSDFVRVSAWEAGQEEWTPTRHVCTVCMPYDRQLISDRGKCLWVLHSFARWIYTRCGNNSQTGFC